ncbi:WbqC family protein [Oligoflexia bacterium]|nr:WbqC family protein [Oligoflexia bacterium]
MKLGIMQPYFLPYIGYFQLINAVDEFVIYDNVKYTKKGWINRNMFLQDGKGVEFTIPLKKASDSLDVNEREVSSSFNQKKLLNRICTSYQKAPYFDEALAVLTRVVNCTENNLFRFVYYSVKEVCKFLNITTKIMISSNVDIDHSLRGEDRVLAICKANDASMYINAIGGQKLYSYDQFLNNGVELKLIKSDDIEYKQFNHDFVPWLSMLDVVMFNGKDKLAEMLERYRLL